MTTTERNQRANDIVARRKAGETLEAIATDYGMTRERVRQIAAKVHPKHSVVAVAVRAKDREARRRAARIEKLVAKNCVICGERFLTMNPRQVAHTGKCSRVHHNRTIREWVKAKRKAGNQLYIDIARRASRAYYARQRRDPKAVARRNRRARAYYRKNRARILAYHAARRRRRATA